MGGQTGAANHCGMGDGFESDGHHHARLTHTSQTRGYSRMFLIKVLADYRGDRVTFGRGDRQSRFLDTDIREIRNSKPG